MESITTYAIGMTSSAGLKFLFKIILFLFDLAPQILFGFIGNYLYVQQIHKKIDQGYHLSNVRSIDKLTWSISQVTMVTLVAFMILTLDFKVIVVFYIFLASILGFIAVKRDERELKIALAARALQEQGDVLVPGEPTSLNEQ